MADLKTNIELDDQRFARASQRVEADTRKMGRAMQRSFAVDAGRSADALVSKFATVDFAIQTLKRGLAFATGAVAEYRKEFPGLTRGIDGADAAVQRFRLSLGRDLALAVDSSTGLIAGFIDTADSLRRGLSDLVASAFGSDVAAVNEALAISERQDDAQRQRLVLLKEERRADELIFELEAERARLAGDVEAAEVKAASVAMRRITDEATARKQSLQAQRLGAEAHAAAVQRIDEQTAAKREMVAFRAREAIARHAEEAAERERRAAEETLRLEEELQRLLSDAQEDEQRQGQHRFERRESLEDAAAQRAIELAGLEGRRREAELMGLQLRFARERRDIERDEVLLAEDKRRALAQLAEDEQRITGLVMQRTRDGGDGRRERGVAGGTLGGRNVMAQQVGVRADQKTADSTARTAKMTEEIRNLLRQLGVVLAQPRPGVFG